MLLFAAAAARADIAVPPPALAHPLGQAAVPARGAGDADVVIVEFADFQCPYCARSHDTLAQLEREFHGRMRLEFRHMPLESHHAAMPAAEAAVEAQEQGKFWAFYDAAYADVDPPVLPRLTKGRAEIDRIARQIGLDQKRYQQAMADHRHRARIDADVAFAKSAGVDGTPTFFFNGRRLVGAQPIDRFRAAFEGELARARTLRAAGFSGTALHDALVSQAAGMPEL